MNKLIVLFFVLFQTVLFAEAEPQKFENPQAMSFVEEYLLKEGNLKINEGYIYLKVEDSYILDLLPLLEQENLVIPPYFRSEKSPGAHISVIYESERSQLPPNLPEIDQKFAFEVKEFASVFIADHTEAFVLIVTSPELESLRKKYGLSSKLLGHEYHITIALKEYPKDQVIMKELRFWYNGKWLNGETSIGGVVWDTPKGPRLGKPFSIFKGLPDDYHHLTRKDLRFWWNKLCKYDYYPICEGFEDDDVPVTFEFLEKWFKTIKNQSLK